MFPIEDDHEPQDYDRAPDHHTDVYTYQAPRFQPAALVADPLDRITLAYLRAIWALMGQGGNQRCLAYDLLCDVVLPYHQRGSTWQIYAARVRNGGGVGPTPYQNKQAIKSEVVTVKLGN